MNTISNYGFQAYAYMKKADTKNDEKDSTSSETKTELTANNNVANGSSTSTSTQNIMASAYEAQNSSSMYIMFSSQPLNNTLTKYRDMYPNIIGFTAKVQSSLNSLCQEYRTKLCGLTSKFTNCRTEEDFAKIMKEFKNESAKLMKEYEAKLNTLSALTYSLPALSDVRDKCVGTEINMHNEIETILKGITTSDNKSGFGGAEMGTQEVGKKLDRESITQKMQEMKLKNNEYKEELKNAEKNGNETKIKENQSLITGSQKLIDVYSTVLKVSSK